MSTIPQCDHDIHIYDINVQQHDTGVVDYHRVMNEEQNFHRGN